MFAFQTNEKGQVVTKTSLLKQMEELIEEPGLTCCICREGYKFQVHATSRVMIGQMLSPNTGKSNTLLVCLILADQSPGYLHFHKASVFGGL